MFTVSYASATFTDANVGTNKPVSVTGISIAVADAGNYAPTSATASTTASITAHASSIAIASSAATSVYGQPVTFTATVTGNGGSPTGSVTFTDGASTILGTGTLSGGMASITTSTLTVGSHSVTAAYGGDGNYDPSAAVALTQPITSATVTAIITVSSKVHDGTNSATIASRSPTGVFNPDVVTLTGGTAIFADKNAGDGITVTVTGLGLSGAAAGNYQLSSSPVTTTANITKANQSITWSTPADIVYGTALSSTQFSATVAGVAGGTAPGAMTFAPAAGTRLSAGNGQTLSVTAAATTNYDSATASVTINVNKATASVTPADVTKALGTPDPPLTGTLSGFVPSDNVKATYSRTPRETVAGSPYAISATLSPTNVLSNYTIVYSTGKFSITSAAPPELLVRFDVAKKDIVVLEFGTLAACRTPAPDY